MTGAKQTKLFFADPPGSIVEKTQITGVTFIRQSAGYCGPASLAMALNWAGSSVEVEDIQAQVYSQNQKGSLQGDMISASRRNGMMAVTIHGLTALLRELEAGHPVIIFENLGLSWIPQYHYAIVFGYDLKQRIFILHSGPDAFKTEDMAVFELSWHLADYWGLVVLPPGELAVSADELSHASAAASLENLGKMAEAEKAYFSILKKWPTSLSSLIGLGNVFYFKKDFKNSVFYLKKAIEVAPTSEAARHNLEIAQKAMNGAREVR